MTNDNQMFVSYHIANELISLGFKERCPGYFANMTDLRVEEGWSQVGTNLDEIPAPTFTQTVDWFLKKYNLFSTIDWYGDKFRYGFKIIDQNTNNVVKMEGKIESYSIAKLVLLQSLINLCRNNKS